MGRKKKQTEQTRASRTASKQGKRTRTRTKSADGAPVVQTPEQRAEQGAQREGQRGAPNAQKPRKNAKASKHRRKHRTQADRTGQRTSTPAAEQAAQGASTPAQTPPHTDAPADPTLPSSGLGLAREVVVAIEGRQRGKEREPGRPSKLTPQVGQDVVLAMEAGNFLDTAAAWAGIDVSTVHRWMRIGREEADLPDKQRTEFYEFYHFVTRAEARSEVRAVILLRRGMDNDWRAAAEYLRRRHPSKWNRAFGDVNVRGKGTQPVSMDTIDFLVRALDGDDEDEE